MAGRQGDGKNRTERGRSGSGSGKKNGNGGEGGNGEGGGERERRPLSNYNFDEAVLKVQEWNEALKCEFSYISHDLGIVF